MVLKGIDVSHYQSDIKKIDWVQVRPNIDFAIIKAGYGRDSSQVDAFFEENYRECERLGIPKGCYWYSYANSVEDAEREAKACLQVIKGKRFEYPIYFDIEYSGQAKFEKQLMTDMVDKFCSTIENAGYFAGWYTYTNWALNKFNADYLNRKYTFWLADYRQLYDQTIKRDIHQYSSSGHIDGIYGRVDLNHCTRDFPTIIKSSGLNGYGKKLKYCTTGRMSAGDQERVSALLDSLSVEQKWSE